MLLVSEEKGTLVSCRITLDRLNIEYLCECQFKYPYRTVGLSKIQFLLARSRMLINIYIKILSVMVGVLSP